MSPPQDVDSYVELVLGTRRDRAVAQTPLAFMVDGDNATARLIKEMLAEASKYGVVIVRNVYGDWTTNQLAPWKEVMQEHALDPEQQYANVSGKNATDSKMIIDAMDLLHEGVVKGFCLVSSDSDFTALAKRVRRAGLFVMGIGRSTTPLAFQRACHIFVATENLAPTPSPAEPTASEKLVGQRPLAPAPIAPPPRAAPRVALDILRRAFDNADSGDGIVHLANLGVALYRLDPAFDPRTYGKAKLVELIEAFPEVFAVERPSGPGPGAVYVRKNTA